jgi:hypothetical protein
MNARIVIIVVSIVMVPIVINVPHIVVMSKWLHYIGAVIHLASHAMVQHLINVQNVLLVLLIQECVVVHVIHHVSHVQVQLLMIAWHAHHNISSDQVDVVSQNALHVQGLHLISASHVCMVLILQVFVVHVTHHASHAQVQQIISVRLVDHILILIVDQINAWVVVMGANYALGVWEHSAQNVLIL